eukprot:SM000145S00802  [mRNA]  locus=s145:151615:158524:- [translate_table: standard]
MAACSAPSARCSCPIVNQAAYANQPVCCEALADFFRGDCHCDPDVEGDVRVLCSCPTAVLPQVCPVLTCVNLAGGRRWQTKAGLGVGLMTIAVFTARCGFNASTVGLVGTPACLPVPRPPPPPAFTATPALRAEQTALLAVKAALSDPLGNLTGWAATDATPCGWAGVTCSSTGAGSSGPAGVTALRLPDCQLGGALAPAIGDLSQLEVLNLARNQLGGAIPAALGRLARLRVLKVGNNNFTGTIPPLLGACSALRILDLNRNAGITGDVPAALGGLRNLEFLYLTGCNLTGPLPSAIGGAVALKYLDIEVGSVHGSGLTGPIPPEIGQLKNLEVIRMRDNSLSGAIPPELGNCSSLKVLALARNKLSGPLPPQLGRLAKLGAMHISDNQLSGAIPQELAALPLISYFAICRTRVNGSIPPALGRAPLLQTLLLTDNQLSGEVPRELGKCKQLESIHLQGNRLTGLIPKELGTLPRLITIELQNNGLDGPLPPELAEAKLLQILSVQSNRLSGNIPPALGRMANLTVLLMSENWLNGSIPPALGSLSSLFQLNASFNRLTGSIPLELGSLRSTPLQEQFFNPRAGTTFPVITRLQFIDLSSNDLNGSLPATLGQLKGMQLYNFSNNQLQGSIPPTFGNCSALQRLDLSSNVLGGKLSISLPDSLTHLYLSENHFEGPIPVELQSLTELQVLDLAGNNLYGDVPTELGSLAGLTLLRLRQNSLQGTVPKDLGQLTNLQALDLGENKLQGPLPEDFRSLNNLLQLNVSHNRLSGHLPEDLGKLVLLQLLDLSYNGFTGSIPVSYGALSSLSSFNASYNDLSGSIPSNGPPALLDRKAYSGNSKLCTTSDPNACPNAPSKKSDNNTGVIIGCSVGGAVLLAAFLLLTLCLVKRHKHASLRASLRKTSQTGTASGHLAVFHKVQETFTYQDIVDETDNFSPAFAVGSGGFGTVYRVQLASGTLLAVKKVSSTSLQGEKEFLAEVNILGKIKHRHLVTLRGAYSGTAEVRDWLLIYDFVDGGSLEDYLRDSWTAASGGVMNGQTESEPVVTNLVDSDAPQKLSSEEATRRARFTCEWAVRMKAMLTHLLYMLLGTIGYLAPECAYMSRVSEKSDVYSYGIVLLQLIVGSSPTHVNFQDYEGGIVGWTTAALQAGMQVSQIAARQLVVPEKNAEAVWQEVLGALKVGILCTAREPAARPTMAEVVHLLESLQHMPTDGTVTLSSPSDWDLSTPGSYASSAAPTSIVSSSNSESTSFPPQPFPPLGVPHLPAFHSPCPLGVPLPPSPGLPMAYFAFCKHRAVARLGLPLLMHTARLASTLLAHAVHTRAGRAMAAASGSPRCASFPAASYSDLMLLTRSTTRLQASCGQSPDYVRPD